MAPLRKLNGGQVLGGGVVHPPSGNIVFLPANGESKVKILLQVLLTIGWDFICEKIIFVTKAVPEIYQTCAGVQNTKTTSPLIYYYFNE